MSGLADWLSQSPLNWAAPLTLTYLLSGQPWRSHMPAGTAADLLGQVAIAACAAGLLIPGAATSPWMWLAITCLHFAWLVVSYHVADNHHFLQGYWCIAILSALYAGPLNEERVLWISGNSLIALCFAIAVAVKLANPRYRDGSFFVAVLMADIRFSPITATFARSSARTRDEHRRALARVRAGVSDFERAEVPTRALATAKVLTWWTIGIETAVATAFGLAPFVDDPRIWVLVAFVITTFVAVPVPSFGQLLAIMAMTTVSDVHTRALLLALVLTLGVISVTPQAARRAVTILARPESASRRVSAP